MLARKIRELSGVVNRSQSPTLVTAASRDARPTARRMCGPSAALTGQPAFSGETVTDILARVVTFEPDWAALPVFIPRGIRQVLKRGRWAK